MFLKLRKFKHFINLLSLVILVISLSVLSVVTSQKQIKKILVSEAAAPNLSPPTISSYETNLSSFFDIYNSRDSAYIFSGGLALNEYWDTAFPEYMAGHLGTFFAPPYYSAYPDNQWGKSSEAYNTGLVIMNRNYPNSPVYENSADEAQTTAKWYPGKSVVENVYPGGTKIKGERISIPNVRGFGVRIKITNQSANPQPYSLLILNLIPNMGKTNNWNWVWQGEGYTNLKAYLPGAPELNGNDYVIIKNESSNVYLLLGITKMVGAATGQPKWQAEDIGNVSSIINKFKSKAGELDGANNDTFAANSGSAVAGAVKFNSLSPGSTASFTMLGFVGPSQTDLKALWDSHKTKDIVAYTDTKINEKLESIFNNKLPKLLTGDANFNKLYINSVLSHTLNRWEIFGDSWISEHSYRGHSLAFFPWTTGTEQILAQADPDAWKKQILKLAKLNYSTCRAYSPLDSHLCDVTYSYSRLALVKIVGEYVRVTSDKTILTSKPDGSTRLVDLLENFVNQIDSDAGGAGALANFGTDSNLYELKLNNCKWQDEGVNYEGKVITPNAERYWAHRILYEMYGSLGETTKSDSHNSKAESNKTAIHSLWNSGAGWFYSRSQKDKVFYFAPIYNTLAFWGLLTDTQTNALLDKISGFEGQKGFYAIKDGNSPSGCTRSDWQGPGLYSGAVGLLLKNLYQNNKKDEAYKMTQRYYHMANMPVMAQMYNAKSLPFQVSANPGYVESLSFAQAVIQGMLGLNPVVGSNPSQNLTWFEPRVPNALLDKGEVQIDDAFSQGHLWSLKAIKNQNYQLYITANAGGVPLDHFRFGLYPDKSTNVYVSNLISGSYSIRYNDPNSNPVYVKDTSNGVLSFTTNGDPKIIFINKN